MSTSRLHAARFGHASPLVGGRSSEFYAELGRRPVGPHNLRRLRKGEHHAERGAAMVRSNIVRLGILNLSGAWATTPIMVAQKPASKGVPVDLVVSSAGPRPGWWFRQFSSSGDRPHAH